jgi:hypothetical protein
MSSVLAGDLTLALDPVRFAERVGLPPDPWQARALRSTAPRLLLNASRQSGKSTTVAALALHTALYDPGALVLMLSPSLRQSGELFRKALGMYRSLALTVPAESETALTLTLESGSRIVSLPGRDQTIRGYSGVRLVLIDEASRVEDGLYFSVRPMVAVSGGRIIGLSTPWGQRGWWHREWTEGSAWEKYEVPATDCPRISPAFLEEERRSMGAQTFASEYLCQFVATEDQVFSDEDIAAALTPGLVPLFPFGGISNA